MPDPSAALFEANPGKSWIRLQTLNILRWVAVAGQIGAIGVADRVFAIQIELGFCAAIIGLSIIANLIFHFVYPESKRLTEREAVAILLFDTMQLGLLILLTGGLNNPFAVLIAAPVTVAATALSLRSTLLIGAAAIALISFAADLHVPLRTTNGDVLRLPDVFIFGSWVAIVVAIGFIAAYTRRISTETQSMSQALLAAQMALAREQKLTDLGGVVAAAAHELGTPLATIKLVSAEMVSELPEGSDLREDAQLIRDQADRCRDILRSMGRSGKDDLHLRQAPLVTVVEEAADPHRDRGKAILIETDETDQPTVFRRPELVHGLRNLVQNAVDFAATTVWIDIDWDEDVLTVRIVDDGTGYPPQLLGRIGDPFIRRRRSSPDRKRPEYEGMGLGLFIAKTLLERTGAELTFANGQEPYSGVARPGEPSGAIVEVVWPRRPGGIEAEERLPALGENVNFPR
ncbi:ActS/PrrB/RegB family redox-sensitive histidine kinase [Maritimibacter sp. UBA3975]|uniref:sensor histidine kinase RegB n=1 Tax=Maritimibacter sp. UBA3975 TaxID=1946833 RepID=UPI000C0A7A98|nr:ActS/PrrB/RegB family redox-sensitive histidine kinase [Maritimibacter sp. UBA3975]MAM63404.1 two-component sensor histidine kinase [Maritimibacter sp.]|tara:strand:- start:76151 stop:77530 length:1380 start_codon:yes stop_codon:yes gene_type:complete